MWDKRNQMNPSEPATIGLMDGDPELRRRIESARVYGGFRNQGALAKAIDLHPKTFQRRLNGVYNWRRADLLAIAEACRVPLWFLEQGFSTSRGTAEDVSEEEEWGLEIEGVGGDSEDKRGRA